jgi:5-methylcytosine-specific restriction endonuclease McrA
MFLDRLLAKISPQRPRVSNEYKYVYASCDPSKCYYCSLPAKAMDHVLPVSLARLMPYFEFSSELLQLVPCCTRCNSIAGNKFFASISAKRKYILERICELRVRAQYAEVLSKLDKLLSN